jgi:hypothetical protein
VTWHAEANMPGNYHTLCSLSLDDDLQESVEPQGGQKVTCVACRNAFMEAKRFKASDFDC